jgi:hypothetical protein
VISLDERLPESATPRSGRRDCISGMIGADPALPLPCPGGAVSLHQPQIFPK